MTKRPIPTCPKCGNPAAEQSTSYGPRYACCGLWSWGRHRLVDAETHEARRAAHAAFDPIWKSGRMKRSDAYAALAKALEIEPHRCHMKLMNKDEAKRVPLLAKTLADQFEDAQ